MLEGKCSCLRAKSAQIPGNLPHGEPPRLALQSAFSSTTYVLVTTCAAHARAVLCTQCRRVAHGTPVCGGPSAGGGQGYRRGGTTRGTAAGRGPTATTLSRSRATT